MKYKKYAKFCGCLKKLNLKVALWKAKLDITYLQDVHPF